MAIKSANKMCESVKKHYMIMSQEQDDCTYVIVDVTRGHQLDSSCKYIYKAPPPFPPPPHLKSLAIG